MLSTKKMEEFMSLILILGMLLASILVITGGTLYLIQNGGHFLSAEWSQSGNYQTSFLKIWQTALTHTPTGFIELGLLILVITQVIRVAMLVWFYMVTRDVRFTIISMFIFITLIYSFFGPH